MIAAGKGASFPAAIGTRAGAKASPNALLARWLAYQVATAVLTHEVGPRVSPERTPGLERAAGALLLSEREGAVV